MRDMNVSTYMVANSKYFASSDLPVIRSVMEQLPDEAQFPLSTLELQDPTTMLILSLFLGGIGVDRFMVGDIALGVIKLLTLGGCGILSIIDLFIIMGRTRDVNYVKFMTAAASVSPLAEQIVYAVDPTLPMFKSDRF